MLKTIMVLPDGTQLTSGADEETVILSSTVTESVNEAQELTLGSVCAAKLVAKVFCPGEKPALQQGQELAAYRWNETATDIQPYIILPESSVSPGFTGVLYYEMLEGQQELAVTYDGRLFVCTPHFSYDPGDGYFVWFGNQSLMNAGLSDSGEPFYFYGYKGSSSLLAKFEDKESHSVSVSGYREVSGKREPMGIFRLEKLVQTSANTLTLTGYDRVTRLDQDLSRWFAGLDGWPYSLYTLAAMVCDACGLELANESIPNGDHPVQAFSASGITGRTLMKWIGQACGRFCRATPEGKIEFAWYAPVTPEITPGGEVFYFRNGLTYEDYTVYPIEKVQVHQTQDDVGVVWPDETGEKNTYVITGNLLLTTENTDALLPVVQSLYEQLCPVSYTPCRVTIPGKPHIRAGSIVTITDRNGKTITAYVMTSTLSGNRQTLECTGSYRRDSTTAVNQQSYGALDGKILNLQTDVEGISSENKDTAGKVSLLQQTVDGISTRVSDQQGQISQIQQSANAVSVRVGQIENGGVSKVVGMGYSFTDSGLLIEKDRDSVKTKIDNQGMEVSSYDTPVLTANKRGVVAVDVSVKNYLEIGHARFEDYTSGADSNRTACFFI